MASSAHRGFVASVPSVAHAYHGVLTGGLSNQLMHLAEALERACSADAYLVLPRFNAGWFNHVDAATGHASQNGAQRAEWPMKNAERSERRVCGCGSCGLSLS